MNFNKYMNKNALRQPLALVFALCALWLQAQTVFTGPVNGDWATASNWSNGVPAVGNDAIIPGGASALIAAPLNINFTVNAYGAITMEANVTVQSGGVLSPSAGFTATSGALTVASGGTFNSFSPLSISASASFVNNGTFNFNAPITCAGSITNTSNFIGYGNVDVTGGSFINSGTFSTTQTLTIGNFTNQANATLKIESGGTLRILAGGTLQNAATATIIGAGSTCDNNGTINNLGKISNFNLFKNLNIFNNDASASEGRFEGNTFVENSGIFTNKVGAVITGGFRITNTKDIINFGAVTVGGEFINSAADALFSNEMGATLTSSYGTNITNNGNIFNKSTAIISLNATVNSSGNVSNFGTFNALNGTNLTSSGTFSNNGTIKNENNFVTAGTFNNVGIFNNNSGGTLRNNGTFTNALAGSINNNFEVYNNATKTFINNGRIFNEVRFYNEGVLTNNNFIQTQGDIFNRITATLTNNELIEIRNGSLCNEGSLRNTKTLINQTCSFLKNTNAIDNTGGNIQNFGLMFQRGTITGNAVTNAASAYTHTNATSDAPICQNVNVGTNFAGEAKLYAQSLVSDQLLGIDSCNSFVYTANGIARPIFSCSEVGTIQNVRLCIKTRTADSLTCTAQATIIDDVAPTFENCPKDVTVLTTTATGAAYSWTTPSVSDNCTPTANIVRTNSHTSGSNFPLGTTIVTLSARDASNNNNDCQFRITVQQVNVLPENCGASDTTRPRFANCPTNMTLNAPNGVAAATWAEPTVTDNCYPIALNISHASGSFFPVGTTTVTYTATDSRNNVGTCSFTVTVPTPANPCTTDNIPPVITNCPKNIFIQTNPTINGGVAVWATPSVSDNCGAATLQCNYPSGRVFPVGSTIVSYLAMDARNNMATCDFVVTVGTTNTCANAPAPTLVNCPTAPIQVTTSSYTSALVNWIAPTVTDACAPTTISTTHRPNNNFPLGTTPVTYTASNGAGVSSSCTFNVIVRNVCAGDTVRPTFTNCPANISVFTPTSSTTSMTVNWTPPSVTDNCGGATLVASHQPNAVFPVGTTTVTYRATDFYGNFSTCSFTVTVNQRPPSPFDPTKCYRIAVKLNGKSLVIQNGTSANGERIVQRDYADRNDFKWKIEQNAAGFYIFKSAAFPTKALQIESASTVNGAFAQSWDASETATHQQWAVERQTDNSFRIVARHSGKALSIMGSSLVDNAMAIQWDWLSGEHQQFYIVEVPCTTQTINCTRITNGLLALYDFKEGSGSIVRDKSNVGEPLDLTIKTPANTNWLTGGCGLSVNTNTIIKSTLPATKIARALAQSNAYTVELWVKPATLNQNLGNMMTCSDNTTSRNFTAGQHAANYMMNTRTTTTTNDAMPNFTLVNRATTNLQHVVYTRDASGLERMFVNGVQVQAEYRYGNLTNWSQTAFLAFANEMTMDRPWLGSIYLGAVYGRALLPQEVTTNFNAGACCAGNTPPPTNCIRTRGSIIRETWTNIGGTVVADLLNNPNYPNNPNSRTALTQFRITANLADNYGDRVRGFIYPPTTGTYYFYVYGDDQTELYLNPTGNAPTGKQRIAFVNGWTNEGELTRETTQKSVALNLTAGQEYYIELLHKEGSGGDHFGVAWQLPNTTSPILVSGNHLAQYSECTPPPTVCMRAGYVTREVWANHTAWNFPIVVPTTLPNLTTGQGNLEGAANIGDNYLTRVRGYLRPQETGNYSFNITGDDNVELFLSTDETPTNMRRIAFINGFTNIWEENKYASQTSASINFTAGRAYYFELRHKEAAGGDHWRIRWKTPSNATAFQIINSQFLASPCVSATAVGSTTGNTTPDMFITRAYKEGVTSKIMWINNTGEENEHFVVERVNNVTSNFEALDIVKNKGVSNFATDYIFTDVNPQEGENHYRVRLLLKNGTEKISDVMTLDFGKLNALRIFPNPTDEIFQIDLKPYQDRQVTIYIYNSMGQEVHREIIEKATAVPVRMESVKLPSGTYTVRVSAEGKRTAAQQLIIMK